MRAVMLALAIPKQAGGPVEVPAYPSRKVPGLYVHRTHVASAPTSEWQVSTGQGLWLRGGFGTLSAAMAYADQQHPDMNWEHVTYEGWQRRKAFDPAFYAAVERRRVLGGGLGASSYVRDHKSEVGAA